MNSEKKVLLIAGGGTLGTYTGKELLRLGCSVDVLCPEEKISDHERLRFHRGLGTAETLTKLFAENHYDGIVNFIHYHTLEAYKAIHPLLIANTDRLIFLSSYRVYADLQHPITETAPRLYDTTDDPFLLEEEDYSTPKAKCEDYLRNECADQPWTIVRPVISFSHRRLDLLLYSGTAVVDYTVADREMLMPELVKNFGAGLDWAGNSGKLIANLLFKPAALHEAFTIYSGHGATWGDAAKAYQDILGLKIRWCSEEEFVENTPAAKFQNGNMWIYDRRYDRTIDCSKVLSVTGLQPSDFTSLKDGIRTELAILRDMARNDLSNLQKRLDVLEHFQ